MAIAGYYFAFMSLPIDFLRALPLLEGLDDPTLQAIAQRTRAKEFQRREFVIHKGSAGDELCFVLRGRLQVVDVAEDGREVGLAFLLPGEFFGELSVIDGQPRSASVLAVSHSIVGFMPKAIALQLFCRSPIVAERILRHLGQKLRESSAFRSILSIPNAYQRIYALIQHFARLTDDQRTMIDNMPTHQQIAIMANTSRETVTRALGLLQEHGVLQKNARQILVLQPQALRTAAENGQIPGGKAGLHAIADIPRGSQVHIQASEHRDEAGNQRTRLHIHIQAPQAPPSCPEEEASQA